MATDLHEDLRPASYKGFEFLTPEDSAAFGRRWQTHQFPGRDDPAHEDLGLDVQRYRITAVIAGTDYYSRAGEFEALLKEAGPGRLVHPYYGEIEIVVKSARRRHSTRRVGEVVFFIEAEKHGKVAPTTSPDTSAELKASTDTSFAALQDDLGNRLLTTFVPDFVTADALDRVTGFTDNLRSTLGVSSFQPDVEWPAAASLPIASPSALSASLGALYKGLALSVKRAASPVIGPVAQATAAPDPVTANAIPTDRAVVAAVTLAKAADHRVTVAVPPPTSTQKTVSANALTLDLAQRGMAVTAAVAAARHARYESREQAVDTRDKLAARLFALRDDLGAAGWDEAWSAASAMLSALTRDINARIGRLPRTATVRSAGLRSSAALANRIYGDDPALIFERATDITLRNRLRHPGFVPADDLEVLV